MTFVSCLFIFIWAEFVLCGSCDSSLFSDGNDFCRTQSKRRAGFSEPRRATARLLFNFVTTHSALKALLYSKEVVSSARLTFSAAAASFRFSPVSFSRKTLSSFLRIVKRQNSTLIHTSSSSSSEVTPRAPLHQSISAVSLPWSCA